MGVFRPPLSGGSNKPLWSYQKGFLLLQKNTLQGRGQRSGWFGKHITGQVSHARTLLSVSIIKAEKAPPKKNFQIIYKSFPLPKVSVDKTVQTGPSQCPAESGQHTETKVRKKEPNH